MLQNIVKFYVSYVAVIKISGSVHSIFITTMGYSIKECSDSKEYNSS